MARRTALLDLREKLADLKAGSKVKLMSRP